MELSSKYEMKFSVIRIDVRRISVICCYENECTQYDPRSQMVR